MPVSTFSAGGLLGRALGAGGDGRGAGVGDVGQDLLLEAHVALDRVHEVRDQVVAALELDLDLGERLVDPEAPLDQAVVDPDHEDHRDDDDRDDDDQLRCSCSPSSDGSRRARTDPARLSLAAAALDAERAFVVARPVEEARWPDEPPACRRYQPEEWYARATDRGVSRPRPRSDAAVGPAGARPRRSNRRVPPSPVGMCVAARREAVAPAAHPRRTDAISSRGRYWTRTSDLLGVNEAL